MVMWRCLIVAVGAALARSDAAITQDKLDALESAFQEGEYSLVNDVEAVRGILDTGWDVNRRFAVNGQTLLHLTAKHGNSKVVQLLVDYGATVDLQDSEGSTPLLVASIEKKKRSTENVKALLDSGADPNIARADDGRTPLHSAASWGTVETIDKLVEHGAYVDAIQRISGKPQHFAPGFTPLYFAVFYKRKDAIAALTRHGADWDTETGFSRPGITVADIGARNGMTRDQFEHLTRSDAPRTGGDPDWRDRIPIVHDQPGLRRRRDLRGRRRPPQAPLRQHP